MSETKLCKRCDRPIGNLAKKTKGFCPRCLAMGMDTKKPKK